MAGRLLAESKDINLDLCNKFIKKVLGFGMESCSLPESMKTSRVELKKCLLNATRGRSLAKFVSFLGTGEKQDLKTMMHMECPVICPNRKLMLTPIESMPANVMKSSKKLRNFFGVPEVQICRSCVKRSRCRRYQQVERDTPDLSDLASLFIGLHSTCKLRLQGSSLVQADSLKELPSVIAVLDALSEYFKAFPRTSLFPRGDEKRCKAALQRRMKMKEMEKVSLLKEKVFNIPENFSVMPASNTYLSGFQRELYNKLQKDVKKEADDTLWVADTADTTIEEKYSDEMFVGLRKVTHMKDKALTGEPCSIEDLEPGQIQFRMTYSRPIGGDEDLVRYDILNDSFIQGIKVNTKGRVVIDLEQHLSNSQREEVGIEKGIESYRPVSEHKIKSYETFLNNIPSHASSLSILKVPYNYQCQSSGEIRTYSRSGLQSEVTDLQDIAVALCSQGSRWKT